jgi:L-fuconolactonase
MMFGSDWPVCLLAATYSQTIQLIENFTKQFSLDEQNRFGLKLPSLLTN